MRGKILIAIILAALAFSAYQIVAHPINPEKANTEIFADTNIIAAAPAQGINYYSENFESLLKTCAPSGGPQKYYVQPSNPAAKELALSLTKESKTDLEKTKALFDYASGAIKYKIYDNWRTTNEVLETSEGDCTDKSIVLVSMLKNVGIESYVVYGTEKNDYSHAWVFAKIDGKWIQMDATIGEFYYVYSCLENQNCENRDYYLPIAGIFDENRVLKCDITN